MSSLESKLETGKYNELTPTEITLLRRAFDALPTLREPRKTRIDALLNSYKQPGLELEEKSEHWRSEPSDFLASAPIPERDATARLFQIVDWLDNNKALNRLAKRTVCLALAQLHPKYVCSDDLLLRFQGNLPDQEKAKIKKKLPELFRAGNQWKKIIELCAFEGNSIGSSYHGVIWLLRNGSAWERATEDECKQAIRSFGPDFLAKCNKFDPSVTAVLTYLKQGVAFRSYTSPDCRGLKRRNDAQDLTPGKRRCLINQAQENLAASTETLGLVADTPGGAWEQWQTDGNSVTYATSLLDDVQLDGFSCSSQYVQDL